MENATNRVDGRFSAPRIEWRSLFPAGTAQVFLWRRCVLLGASVEAAGATSGIVWPLDEEYDCMACGACCFGKRDYVQVFAHDAATLGPARTAELVAPAVGEIPASVGRESEPKRFMKMIHGHCIALNTATPNRFVCTVYEDRPVLCRALEPGSAACLEARARMKVLSSAAKRGG